MRFAFIRDHASEFPVSVMCRVLEVSRSGYYTWAKRKPGPREERRAQLVEQIREVHEASRGIYGSPRVHQDLQEKGIDCCVNTVAKLMKDQGIRSKTSKKFRISTTDSRHPHPIAKNHLAQDFQTTKINEVWLTDITYIATGEGWLYLAAVLDLCSRKIVGWSTSSTPQQEITLEALTMAVETRRPRPGLIHHTDRGSQYSSAAYQDLLDEYGMRCSMSRPGQCLDNAAAESFFHTLKTEWIYHAHYKTRREARLAIFEYIESFYNTIRMHSSLDYRSPEEYERLRSAA